MAGDKHFDLGGESASSPSLVSNLKNKLLYLVMGLVVLVLAAFSTVGIISLLEGKKESAVDKQIAELRAEISSLQTQIQDNKQSLDAQYEVMASSDAASFRKIFIRQEKSYQRHLNALKQGMRDLAKMLPGSRTWLEIYNEQINLVIAQSKQRVAELEAMQKGTASK